MYNVCTKKNNEKSISNVLWNGLNSIVSFSLTARWICPVFEYVFGIILNYRMVWFVYQVNSWFWWKWMILISLRDTTNFYRFCTQPEAVKGENVQIVWHLIWEFARAKWTHIWNRESRRVWSNEVLHLSSRKCT